ncbi:MAG: hypothetical protein KJ747_07905 [Actinobacteria bacterium]|nr:hypothetical protein [Actinomycetota bacterium]MCG2806791.1 hypothetical protein [Coriobacteriia bacterium]
MRSTGSVIALLAVACVLGAPGSALAMEQGSTQLVSRTVTTVSGTQIAGDLIKQLQGVEFGSDSTTVTLDVDGQSKAVSVGYQDLLGGSGKEGGRTSLLPLALISAGVGGLLKFLSILTRLGR